jgi:hypothetical protein
VLAATPLASQAERRRPAIESDDYPPRYTLALALKDARLIIKAAEKADVDVRLLKATQSPPSASCRGLRSSLVRAMWPSDDLESLCDLTQLPFTQASREVLANAAEVSASS